METSPHAKLLVTAVSNVCLFDVFESKPVFVFLSLAPAIRRALAVSTDLMQLWAGAKRVYTTTVGPLFSRSVA